MKKYKKDLGYKYAYKIIFPIGENLYKDFDVLEFIKEIQAHGHWNNIEN